jgi:hypothetical protein
MKCCEYNIVMLITFVSYKDNDVLWIQYCNVNYLCKKVYRSWHRSLGIDYYSNIKRIRKMKRVSHLGLVSTYTSIKVKLRKDGIFFASELKQTFISRTGFSTLEVTLVGRML